MRFQLLSCVCNTRNIYIHTEPTTCNPISNSITIIQRQKTIIHQFGKTCTMFKSTIIVGPIIRGSLSYALYKSYEIKRHVILYIMDNGIRVSVFTVAQSAGITFSEKLNNSAIVCGIITTTVIVSLLRTNCFATWNRYFGIVC